MTNLSEKDQEMSFEERAKELVSQMTLFEKASQMTFNSPAIERLNIPAYNWWNEALHGVARAGVATVFPQAIAMAATFDEDLVYKTADIISTEGRAKYHEFQRKEDRDIYKGLTFWSPNINIFRDPRWGRGQETYGEDPYLTGRLGVAFIKGLQGNDKKYLKSAACAKHFAVHSGPEADRHSFNAVVSKKDLYETYLPAFKEAVKEAKVEAVMGAYNRTNGEPCCGSKTLLADILRRDWGFTGHVTSDCWALKDFHEGHMVTSNVFESVALALNNGCDVNCGVMYLNLLQAHKQGLVTEEAIDQAVIRLFTTRMKLGMFDEQDQVPYAAIPFEENDSKEHRAAALEMAEKSMVLLKNDNILPLDKNKLKSIAVIGPNADSHNALVGNYCGTASRYVTVLEGIQQAVNEDTRVYYSEGCHLYHDSPSGINTPKERFSEAVAIAEHSDVVIMCMGLDATMEGEEGDTAKDYSNGDKLNLKLPGVQQELLEEVYKTGKPVILVLMSGSALSVTWADEKLPAIVQAWYPGEEGGTALASLLFGTYSPSGRLPVTFYRTTEELPDFSDYSMANRTYRYMKKEALYPFGYGLSYTSFKYSNLRLNKSVIGTGETAFVTATVKNTGSVASDEIAQLYLTDDEASVTVPRWQLKGIRRIALKPGEDTEVSFELTPRTFALINEEGRCMLEPGSFTVYIGGSQPDERSSKLLNKVVLKGTIIIEGTASEIEY